MLKSENITYTLKNNIKNLLPCNAILDIDLMYSFYLSKINLYFLRIATEINIFNDKNLKLLSSCIQF